MEAVVARVSEAFEVVGQDLPEHTRVFAIVRHDPPVPFATGVPPGVRRSAQLADAPDSGLTPCAFVLCTEDFILASDVQLRSFPSKGVVQSSLDEMCNTAQLEIYKASEYNKKVMDGVAEHNGAHVSREDAKFLAGLVRRANNSMSCHGGGPGSIDYARTQKLLQYLER